MSRYNPITVVALTLILAIGCSSGNALPSAAEKALEHSTSFELLSLDPDPLADETNGDGFYGWNVLGSTAITDSGTREKLVSRFRTGVSENNGTVAACFNPRHGIKATHDGKTYEFVICFECYQVAWYIDGQGAEGFLITDSPQASFDEALKDANVPLPQKSKR